MQLVDCARVPVLTVWSGDRGRFQKLKHGQRGALSSHSIKPNDAKCSLKDMVEVNGCGTMLKICV